MARQKARTWDEQIKASKQKIMALSEKLKEEKKHLADLQVQKKLHDQQRILDAFESSGKSLDDIFEYLNSGNE